MSSAEDEFNEHDNALAMPGSKKRRVQRACDICRRKKIRCDGSQMPGNRCSNCIAYNFECTYIEAAKKRGPPKGYVESLENRLEKMEKLLQKLCPDADFSQELGGGPMDRETWLKGNMNGSTSHVMTPYATTPLEDLVSSDDDEMVSVRLADHMQNMSINPMTTRFFGKSSGIMLVQKAIDLKKEYTGDDEIHRHDVLQPKRPEFHGCFPSFLTEDLAASLVDLYFTHINILTPLLHRPTFESKAAQGLHRRNSSFGAVYLLVLAVGSRFSDDPRVFLEGENEHSGGWKFFEQVQMVRKTLLGPPCLEDLQVGTSAPQACWTIVGIGIRLAQDVGAHRRKAYGNKPTVEEELWKRAFWVLVSLDRLMSSSLGRPCAIQDEDFDLELPIECDDEYWEHPDPDQILTTYSHLPFVLSFLLGFVGQQWEQQIVAELDSALNKWIDSVPDHLRWDPNRDINDFFLQSHTLYSSYYHVQILIHRPFIPSPRKPSPLSFPSLAICTNAARSCSHVLDIYRRRSGQPAPYSQMPAFTAGIVLLLNIWGGKRSGLYTDPTKEMADVHKCMSALKLCEKRWHTAGRLWDILYELASVGDLPLPQPSPSGGTKRERDSDSPISAPPAPSPPSDVPRTIAGSRRIGREAAAQSRSNPVNSFNLPLYSDDLGRLPLHGQVNFANTSPSLSSSTNNMWYPHVNGNALQPHATQAPMQNVPPPQDYSHTTIPTTYSMDDMFYEHMSQYSAQYQSPGTSATSPYDNGPQGMQSLISGTPQQNVLPHPGTSIMDTDTIAMWSNAPTGFELNDWGTYITNVSGMVNPDGSASHSRHGP
ncbi:fungal-specific transcription factor domain-containing protein [Suillus ampliporus]|nr:fungal-specific transcription factor domain-containing protein [Suillus ampliporus]